MGDDSIDTTAALLHQLAEARREYAHPGGPHEELIRHEAEVMDQIANALAGECSWSCLVASWAPSWRWHEFGEHMPAVSRPRCICPAVVADDGAHLVICPATADPARGADTEETTP